MPLPPSTEREAPVTLSARVKYKAASAILPASAFCPGDGGFDKGVKCRCIRLPGNCCNGASPGNRIASR